MAVFMDFHYLSIIKHDYHRSFLHKIDYLMKKLLLSLKSIVLFLLQLHFVFLLALSWLRLCAHKYIMFSVIFLMTVWWDCNNNVATSIEQLNIIKCATLLSHKILWTQNLFFTGQIAKLKTTRYNSDLLAKHKIQSCVYTIYTMYT